MLEIIRLVLGPFFTNCYLLADQETDEAVVIDPAWDGLTIIAEARKHGWWISQLWYTHAHFDHIGGSAAICSALEYQPGIALHFDDHDLWNLQGGAPFFGMNIETGPDPTINLASNQILTMGKYQFKVLHTPGHSPGHVAYFCKAENVLFSGDLIFHGNVGRTDLPGGDWKELIRSIHQHVFPLLDETRIFPGHGEETTVGEEKCKNPFLNI
jgi:hydroxyacylglutathione hydrolase